MECGQLVKFLRALADEKRMQIVRLLGGRSICVCELESLVDLAQPAVSHHLKILREAGVVTDTRQGKWIFYSLNRNAYSDVLAALADIPMKAERPDNPDSGLGYCLTCD